jgi:hypothetical protein
MENILTLFNQIVMDLKCKNSVSVGVYEPRGLEFESCRAGHSIRFFPEPHFSSCAIKMYELGFDRANNVRFELPPSRRKRFSGAGNKKPQADSCSPVAGHQTLLKQSGGGAQ